jgi:hypothetical protein
VFSAPSVCRRQVIAMLWSSPAGSWLLPPTSVVSAISGLPDCSTALSAGAHSLQRCKPISGVTTARCRMPTSKATAASRSNAVVNLIAAVPQGIPCGTQTVRLTIASDGPPRRRDWGSTLRHTRQNPSAIPPWSSGGSPSSLSPLPPYWSCLSDVFTTTNRALLAE